MTYQPDFTLPTEFLEQIATQGLDFVPELVRILVNAAIGRGNSRWCSRHLRYKVHRYTRGDGYGRYRGHRISLLSEEILS